jgi:hypothetical protein
MVTRIETLSPVLPLVAALVWGTVLIMLSFALGLAHVQDHDRSLGWISELNWSSTFAFFVPLSLYFSSSVLTSIPQTIVTLQGDGMVRDGDGRPADSDQLIASWRSRAGRSARLAWLFGAIGFAVSWVMYLHNCLLPTLGHGPALIHSWQNGPVFAPGACAPLATALLGFLAYSSQGAAIFCFLYYILMVFTFAAWVFDLAHFGPGLTIYPDLGETDRRCGFQRFQPLIENLLITSIMFFFQFFMTRLYYIFMADPGATSMADLIARTMGKGFLSDVRQVFKGDPGLFSIGPIASFQATMMTVAILVVVISAFIIPAVIVRQAASRSREGLAEAIKQHPEIASQWYGLTPAAARKKLDAMTFWPIRYPQPAQLLLLILLAACCFFFYKLLLLLVGTILFQAVLKFARTIRE